MTVSCSFISKINCQLFTYKNTVKQVKPGLLIVKFGSEVGQIDLKSDKPMTFSDKISVHFGSENQN